MMIYTALSSHKRKWE